MKDFSGATNPKINVTITNPIKTIFLLLKYEFIVIFSSFTLSPTIIFFNPYLHLLFEFSNYVIYSQISSNVIFLEKCYTSTNI